MPTKIHARAARICAAVALVVVCWQAAAAQQPIEVKAGISDPVNTVLAWYMARDAGFYAAQGLKVDIINMSGGSRGAARATGRPARRHARGIVLGDPH
jgi:ABC-type nitrate/sulfonate/bicarbonate transport system substrate-binding protein